MQLHSNDPYQPLPRLVSEIFLLFLDLHHCLADALETSFLEVSLEHLQVVSVEYLVLGGCARYHQLPVNHFRSEKIYQDFLCLSTFVKSVVVLHVDPVFVFYQHKPLVGSEELSFNSGSNVVQDRLLAKGQKILCQFGGQPFIFFLSFLILIPRSKLRSNLVDLLKLNSFLFFSPVVSVVVDFILGGLRRLICGWFLDHLIRFSLNQGNFHAFFRALRAWRDLSV